MRNRQSYHYPTFQQWEDDHIYQARESGNVFYAGSDAIANHWMFGQMDPADPRKAVDPMVSELISLLGEFMSTVEDVLGAFIVDRLIGRDGVREGDEGTVDTDLFEHVSIPFWTNMPSRNRVKP